jgi:hypothetical protein
MHQIEEECATGRQNTTPKAKPLVPQTLLSSVWQTRNFEGDALSFARATMLVCVKTKYINASRHINVLRSCRWNNEAHPMIGCPS